MHKTLLPVSLARRTAEVPALLATLWLAGFFLLAPVADGAVTFFPALLIVTALLFGWRGMASTWRTHQWVFIGWWLFVAGAVLSLVNNTDWGFAGWRFEKYWPFLFLPLVVNLLTRLQRPHWLVVGAALVVGSLAVAAVGAYHLTVLGAPRLGLEDSLNPNRVSEMGFVYAVMLLAALLVVPARWGLRVPLALGMLAAFYGGVAGGSRAALATFTVAALGLAAVWVWRERRWGSALLAAAFLLILAGLVGQTSNMPKRISVAWHNALSYAENPTERNSFSVRLNLWQAALHIAAEHPFVGTGIGDAKHDAQALVDAGEIPLHKGYARFHSAYAGALAYTGLVGLGTLVVGLFVLPAIHLWRRAREAPAGSLAACGAWAGLAVLLFYLPLGLASSWLFNRGMPVFYVAMAVVFALSHFRQGGGGAVEGRQTP